VFVFMYIIRKVAGTTILQLCVRAFRRGFECGSTGTAKEEGIAFFCSSHSNQETTIQSNQCESADKERERETYKCSWSAQQITLRACVCVCARALSPHLPVPGSSKVRL
jgi:hypothetical protein